MKRIAMSLLLTLAVFVAGVASAEVPFQIGGPATQLPEDDVVNGVRLSFLHAKNDSVRGLDLGLLSLSETRELSGLSLVFGMSRLTGDLDGGAVISLINIHSGNDTGLNAAFVNRVHSAERGVGVAFMNIADETTLVDVGGLNVSKESTVQVGFLNVTRKISGFQFGILNIADNGFLPVFPIFNFAKQESEPKK